MRQRIYTIVEKAAPGDKVSKGYDFFITGVSLISLIPLMFKESNIYLAKLDTVMVYLLFMDYVFRWIVHDYEIKKEGKVSVFITYPFSLWAIFDLASILPSLGLLGRQFSILRVLRVTKILHYSKSFVYISNVFHKEKRTLGSVLMIALAYIYISALAMFCYEPETFENFFEALYWATTALTTVGYGDVYPVSLIGRLISMISSLFGIAVIALPAGVVTAGFMEEMGRDKQEKELALAAIHEAAKTTKKDAANTDTVNKDAEAAQEIMEAAKQKSAHVNEETLEGNPPNEIKKGGKSNEQ